MKTTLKTNPELMTVIVNVQMMRTKIHGGYNPAEDFESLSNLTETELYELQDALIPLYNNSLNELGYENY